MRLRREQHDPGGSGGSPGTPDPTSAPPAEAEPVDDPQDGELAGEALTAELKKVREEAASRRVKEREAKKRADDLETQLQAVKAIFDPSGDGKGDPTADAARLQKELAEARIDSVLVRVAAAKGADPDLLVPYLQGSGLLANVDTDDRDALRSELETIVTKALEDRPKLKAGAPAAPPAGGGDGHGGDSKAKVKTFTRSQIKGMSPKEIAENQEAIDAWLAAGSPGIDG